MPTTTIPTLPHYCCSAADRLLAARKAKRDAEAIEAAARQELVTALGSADLARLPDGRVIEHLERHQREYVCPARSYRTLTITTQE